jgi:hypothetical protein
MFKEAISNNNDLLILSILKDKNFNPSFEDNYPIMYLSSYGSIDIIKLLLSDSRVNPADRNNCAIQYAAQEGHI